MRAPAHRQVDSVFDALADPTRRRVVETLARGGTVVIPAFAVGRAQQLMYYISVLKHERAIPDIPVFLNSPMAADVT